MQVIRSIKASDFAALKQIAIESGHGFTSLPVNDEQLAEKIARAEHSINKAVQQAGDEGYLFVLEDSQTGEILGTTGIEASVGLNAPLYHYHLSKQIHHSPTLGVYNTVNILSMCNDYTGSTEICTLFLREQFRNGLAGRLLSRVRFLFMANQPQRFANTVIAEMRGVSDEQGNSPFWRWLQKYFFTIDFPTADHLIGLGNKVFIAELMPKYPIYTNLLSEEAQAVIGNVHEQTQPALRLLEKEGFSQRGYVDLFDAGPTVEVQLDQIKTIKESCYCTVHIAPVNSEEDVAVCNDKIADFRATYTREARYDSASNTLTISPTVAAALLLNKGDAARFIPL